LRQPNEKARERKGNEINAQQHFGPKRSIIFAQTPLDKILLALDVTLFVILTAQSLPLPQIGRDTQNGIDRAENGENNDDISYPRNHA
tara:strand:+ start:1324 stop:1587 length:264 start_codon:yes stop_codon:yes gene_type:complete